MGDPWQGYAAAILERLDIAAEAESLGVEFTSDRVSEDGWRACRAIGREDNRPSAAINVASSNGLRGRYTDLGSGEESISFFDLAVAAGRFSNWKEARDHFAAKVGVESPKAKGSKSKRSTSKDNGESSLKFQPWSQQLCRYFEAKNLGVHESSLLRMGAKFAIYHGTSVVAVPILGPTLNPERPIGHVLKHSNGGMLYAGKGDNLKPIKIKTLGTSGLIGTQAARLRELASVTVIKPEGFTCAAAVDCLIPECERSKYIVVSNAGGATESPKWMAETLAKFDCIVIGDPDTAGESGSKTWAQAIANAQGEAKSTKLVRLPNAGEDLRDWINAGHTWADFLKLLETAETVEPNILPDPIANFIEIKTMDESGEESIRTEPKPLEEILADMHQQTDGWPRRVGSTLFVDDPKYGLNFFDRGKCDGLFGWLRRNHEVTWKSGGEYVSRGEFFAELERTAAKFDAIEMLPHEPPIPNVYYRCEAPPPGDGSHLNWLLNQFRPETPADRELLKASILTLFWGGPPGARPAFVITSDDGRGVGKSKAVQVITSIAGGFLDVSANEDISVLKARFLSPEGQMKRAAVGDNFKTHRLSWAELESQVTSPTISGKAMYVGESQRPNCITWFLTLNGIALATDMAQRSIVIKLVRGANDGTWEERISGYIDAHRQEIIGDAIAALRAPATPLANYSRWAAWEAGVLSRLADPASLQKIILERQAESDTERDELEMIEEFFSEQLRRLKYDVERDQVRIPSGIAARWYGWAVGERVTTTKSTQKLAQASREGSKDGRFARIKPDPSRTHGRGFLWIGHHVDQDALSFLDLEHRIAEEARERSEHRDESTQTY